MKVASVQIQGTATYGRVEDDAMVLADADLARACPDLQSLLASGALPRLANSPGARVGLNQLNFLPVIPNARHIICVGINYRAHMREMNREPTDWPWVFTRFADSLVGHGEPLLRPLESSHYDFEGELALIIGRQAHRVTAAEALDYVAGYTCFMDGSLRDFQSHSAQFTAGKNFWRSGSCGPWLVTTDEIPDPALLNLETRLNGARMQAAPISDLHFSVAEIVAYCSRFCRLQPGDIISTGTPAGVGCARKPPVWMQPGDIIEVAIDGIGVLRNPVEAEH